MGNSILLFLSTYIAVFALGFQSLNVNNGHEKTAFMTSIVISSMNLAILNTCPRIPHLRRVPRQPCAKRGSSGRFGF